MLFKVVAIPLVLLAGLELFCEADDLDELSTAFATSCNEVKSAFEEDLIDCGHVLQKFIGSFRGINTDGMQDPPDVYEYSGYYENYFKAAKFVRNIHNNGLFWSRTQTLQKALVTAKVGIKCADNTFAMKVIDYMTAEEEIEKWCSDTDKSVSINDRCNSDRATAVFWAEASKRMAIKVIGESFYLTTGGYFGPTSYFNRFELSTLLKDESPSTGLSVFNVNSKGSTTLCGTGQLKDLEEMVKPTLVYRCFDVYGDPNKPSEFPAIVACLKDIIAALSGGECS